MSDIDSSFSSFANISEPSASQSSLIDRLDDDMFDDGGDVIDDLPSPSEPDSDDVTVSDEEEESDAEREWKESMQQFELLMSLVLIPYLGKYFGRKFAYWGWKQYMEWQYPVEVVVTNKAAFRGAGAVAAVAPSL